MRLAGLGAAAAALAIGGPAAACAVQGPPMSLLRDAVPARAAPDLVVLRVTMDRFEGYSMRHVVTAAQVDRVVRGNIVGNRIRVEFDTACSNVAGSGRSGYLVGRVSMTLTGLVMRPQLIVVGPTPGPRGRR